MGFMAAAFITAFIAGMGPIVFIGAAFMAFMGSLALALAAFAFSLALAAFSFSFSLASLAFALAFSLAAAALAAAAEEESPLEGRPLFIAVSSALDSRTAQK